MDKKIRCQSCGMPMGNDQKHWGTEADNTPSAEYCQFCFQGGRFTQPEQTVDEMVQSSADFMTANLGFERERAEQMSNDVIRGLKRWN
jgi:hypothetical protein